MNGELDALTETLTWLERWLSGRLPQSAIVKDMGSHRYIPYDTRKFLGKLREGSRILEALGRRADASFLDVGCGAGVKVLLASRLFARAAGLEIEAQCLATARDLADLACVENVAFIEGNAMEFDAYDRYDLLYLYRPFHDTPTQRRLEEKIAAQAREGSVIIGVFCEFESLPEAIRLHEIFKNVYLKSSSEESVRSLKDALPGEPPPREP